MEDFDMSRDELTTLAAQFGAAGAKPEDALEKALALAIGLRNTSQIKIVASRDQFATATISGDRVRVAFSKRTPHPGTGR